MKYKQLSDNRYILEADTPYESKLIKAIINGNSSLKAKEVMDILNISRQTLCNYVKQGLIKIDSTINGKYRYNRKSVISLLSNDKSDV